MIACHQSIRLSHALRELRLGQGHRQNPAPDLEERLRARYEEGVREGEKRLREQLVRQRGELLQLQQGLFQALGQCLPQVRAECESALVGLAFEVAQKLVAALPLSAEMVAAAVREALTQVEAGQDITVLMHAEDLALLQQVNEPVLLSTVAGEKVQFQAAPEVTRGGCVVQTRFGTLDARRETKFELLKKSLLPQ